MEFFSTSVPSSYEEKTKEKITRFAEASSKKICLSVSKSRPKAVYDLVTKQDFFTSANHLAFYLSFDGELNPKPILEKAMEEYKSCYLPVISRNNQQEMSFKLYEEDTSLKKNKWGIQEPSELRSSISHLI